jgi:hypothetical protein
MDSNNRNLSFLFGVLFIISLFLTWINKLDYTLIEMVEFPIFKTLPQQMFQYIGFVFLVLGVLSLLMNFNNKIRIARIVLYIVPLYFIVVCVLNILDSPEIMKSVGNNSGGIINKLKYLGIGFYLFLISYIGLLKYLKVEKIIRKD